LVSQAWLLQLTNHSVNLSLYFFWKRTTGSLLLFKTFMLSSKDVEVFNSSSVVFQLMNRLQRNKVHPNPSMGYAQNHQTLNFSLACAVKGMK
jgi:hypothetical protein